MNRQENNLCLEDVVLEIIETYEQNKTLDFNLDELSDVQFFMEHLYVGIQKSSSEEILKRPCMLDGLEYYLYLRKDLEDGSGYSIKLDEKILLRREINLTVEDAWEIAKINTLSETTVEKLGDILKRMYEEMNGEELEEDFEDVQPMDNLYVLSNKGKVKGASAILNREVIKQLAIENGVDKFIVLPSSIHEMILIPYREDMDINFFSCMVTEVNATKVLPEEQLTDRAYLINV